MKPVLISHALCPYVQRAVIALEEKGAAYERIDIDLAAKPDWFLALSPLGRTPVLRVGDTPLFESAVICEYLEDTLGPALHPADPLARARNRAWIEFSSAMLAEIWQFYTAREEAAYRQATDKLSAMFSRLEAACGEGPYFNGGSFSLVDAAFAPVFRYFDVFDRVAEIDFLTGMPALRRWRSALAARGSVQRAVGADYARRLSRFVSAQESLLAARLAALPA